jgi:hypothetical protein
MACDRNGVQRLSSITRAPCRKVMAALVASGTVGCQRGREVRRGGKLPPTIGIPCYDAKGEMRAGRCHREFSKQKRFV